MQSTTTHGPCLSLSPEIVQSHVCPNIPYKIHSGVQAGTNTWKKVKGVMGDRHASCKPKEKVLCTHVTPVYLYVPETTKITQFCK